MNVDDLLDLTALHGPGIVRKYLRRLTPETQAELRDLLTLQKHGRPRYGAGFVSRPLARAVPRAMTPFGESWRTYKTTYSSRSGAVARARQQQQTHMAIEIVKNAGNWEVHYDDPVPTQQTPFDDGNFPTEAKAIDRARVLRAYGFTVVVRGSGSKWFCRVKAAPATASLPTATGVDSTHTSKDSADTRTHALNAVGFTAAFTKVGSAWEVEITDLPDYTTPIMSASTSSTSSTSSTPSTTAAKTHKVKAGETLYKIATLYGVSVAQLQAANGLTGTTITVGQVLKIPGGSTTTTPPKPTSTTSTSPATTTTTATTSWTPVLVNPPAPSKVTPLYTMTPVGHDPKADWASGVMLADKNLRNSDLTTFQTGSAGKRLEFRTGTTVTLKKSSTDDDWVEVEGTAYESGKAVGTKTGWILRDATTMTRGVFKDLHIDDRNATYVKTQHHGPLTKANIQAIVLHQTGGAKGKNTLSAYTGQTTGAHYLIDETGGITLVVPLNVRAYHVLPSATYTNSQAIGIEHSGDHLNFKVPWKTSATHAADLAAIRTTIQATAFSPKFKARVLGLSDAKLIQFAKDNRDDRTKKPDDWQLYHDINGPQKRASFLLVHKLRMEFAVDDAHVVAHEAIQAKTAGEGENIREFLTARDAYPGLVSKLDTLAASSTVLSTNATLATILANEKALAGALFVDGTPAENVFVATGDAAATQREKQRSHYYDDFWFHYTQLDELVDFLKSWTATSSQTTQLAAMLKAWKP